MGSVLNMFPSINALLQGGHFSCCCVVDNFG